MKIFIAIIIGYYIFLNLLVTVKMSSAEMYEDFVKEQKLVGKIAANILFIPAWTLKAIRAIINSIIK